MHLALTDIYRARWTNDIHEEWIRSVLKNRPDLSREHIAPYEVSAQHPDAFLTHVLDLAPGAVLAALQRLRQSLKNPPVEAGDYLSRLEQHGLSSFVAKLREFETLL